MIIYGLNFSFKMQFLRVFRNNPCGAKFLSRVVNDYQSALIPRKLPCRKKSLVTRLHLGATASDPKYASVVCLVLASIAASLHAIYQAHNLQILCNHRKCLFRNSCLVKNVALNFEPGFIGGSSETLHKKIIFFSRLPITYTIFQEN